RLAAAAVEAAPGTTMGAGAPDPPEPTFTVEVVRRARRGKRIGARLVDGVLVVMIPSSATWQQEQEWVGEMVGRMRRRAATKPIDLAARARTLADRYGLERP